LDINIALLLANAPQQNYVMKSSQAINMRIRR